MSSYSTLYAGLFLFDEEVTEDVKMVLTISLLSLFCVSIVGFVVSLCIFTSKTRRQEILDRAHRLNLALKDKVGRLRTSFRRGTRRGSGGMGEDTSEGLEMGVRNPLGEAGVTQCERVMCSTKIILEERRGESRVRVGRLSEGGKNEEYYQRTKYCFANALSPSRRARPP